MFMATHPELGFDELISIDDDFSTSNDESDLPKYLNIKFDFCDDEDEIPESDGDCASVKFPHISLFCLISVGLFLCLMRVVRIAKIMIAKVAPLPIATSNSSPCDLPSIETFGTEK